MATDTDTDRLREIRRRGMGIDDIDWLLTRDKKREALVVALLKVVRLAKAWTEDTDFGGTKMLEALNDPLVQVALKEKLTMVDGEISDQRRLFLRLRSHERVGQKLLPEDFEDIRGEVAYAIFQGYLVFDPRQGTLCLTERGRRMVEWETQP